MTNWNTYKIKETLSGASSGGSSWNVYELDDFVTYSDGVSKFINCYSYFHDNWRRNCTIEIDLDRIRYKSENYVLRSGDEIMVRKVSSPKLTPVSQYRIISSSYGDLSIPTTPSSAAEVARTVTQTILDHSDRTGGIPQIEIGTNKTTFWYHPPKK